MTRPVSDHYDGRVFHNREQIPHGGAGFFKWMLNRETQAWPKYRPTPVGPKPPASVETGLRVSFVNHATVLIQADGINILTDPIWSKRCSPLQFVGPKRSRDPGIALSDLPKIHIVLISHNHYDHLDSATVRRLVRDHDPLFVVGIGNERLMKKLGVRKVVFLDWWEATQLTEYLPITFVPAQHFSGRSLFDRNQSLWGGFVVETNAGQVYFAGDSGYGEHFKEIAKRFGPPSVALLPIGAYRPRWFMAPVHMDPDDAVRAHIDLNAQVSMGIHFGTFKLTDEGIDDPKVDLALAIERHGIAETRFWLPEFGEGRHFGPTAQSDVHSHVASSHAKSHPSRE